MFAVKLLNALAETEYCPDTRANNYEETTVGRSGKFHLCSPFWGVFWVRKTGPVHKTLYGVHWACAGLVCTASAFILQGCCWLRGRQRWI